jgi:peptidoglycan/xylan/chitin deacetylase (PgdA/CDA1 family)
MSRLDEVAARLDRVGALGALAKVPLWRGVLVLTYHRIGDRTATPLDPDLFSATRDGFAEQVAFLARHCDVVPADDLDARSRRGRHVAITFDDGYRDNHELALPVLRDLGLPATFFVATGFVDRPRLPWWDEIAWLAPRVPGADREDLLRRYKALPAEEAQALLADLRRRAEAQAPPEAVDGLWMTWDMVRDLVSAGMTVGAHTVDHPVLASIAPERQEAEIGTSIRRIEEETGRRPTVFAYPVGTPGTWTGDTEAALRAHGVRYAFAFAGGYQRPGVRDPLAVPRASVTASMSPARIAAMAVAPQRFARW